MFDARETATLLAALRHFQKLDDAKDAYPEHFHDVQPLSLEDINELCVRINSAEAVITLDLRDQSDHAKPTLRCKIEGNDHIVTISFEGYGDRTSLDGHGTPIGLENYKGVPKLFVWGDINREDPTHIIELADAAESLRKY